MLWRRVVVVVGDSLVLVGLIALIHSIVIGGDRFAVGPFAFSNRSAWKILVQVACVALLRHMFVYEPTFVRNLANVISQIRQFTISPDAADVEAPPVSSWLSVRPWFLVVTVVICTRLLVLSTGLIAVYTSEPSGGTARDVQLKWAKAAPLENLHSRWDSAWYASVALYGYEWDPAESRPQNSAFFPAFPLLMRGTMALIDAGAAAVGRSDILSPDRGTRAETAGAVISIVMFVIALRLLFSLASMDLGEVTAARVVILAAAYPFAVFYSAPYTESLYLLVAVGAFLALRLGRFGVMAACGALAGLTRQTGFVLAIPLVMAAVANFPKRDRRIAMLCALSPAFGAALHCAYLWWQFGDPFVWIHAQQAWHPSERWQHIQASSSLVAYVSRYPFEMANIAAVIFAGPWIWRSRRIQPAYCVLGALSILLPLLADVVPLGRLTAPIFPIFLAWAAATKGARRFRVGASIAFVLQLVAAYMFYSWHPLY